MFHVRNRISGQQGRLSLRRETRILVLIDDQMAIQVQRRRHARMPQPRRQTLQVDLLRDPRAGSGVT